MFKKWAVWAAVAMLSWACGSPPAAGGPGGPGGPGGAAAMALPVDMVTLELKPVERTDEFVGTIKSRLNRGRSRLRAALRHHDAR